jgi:hypothetical protein
MAALNGQRTLAQIIAEIDSHLFNQGSSSATSYPTQAMIIRAINKHYMRFASLRQWQWKTVDGTINTVAGIARIAMPDALSIPTNLNIRNIGQNIAVKTRQAFLANYPFGWTNVGNGIPVIAVEAPPAANNARQYDLWPAPDAIYTINYDGFLHVTPLATPATDISIIPPEYEDYLIHAPLGELFTMRNDAARSQYHQKEAKEISDRAFLENEQMIMTMNTVRGDDMVQTQSLIFPLHRY